MMNISIDGTDYSSAVIVDSVEDYAELVEGVQSFVTQSLDDWYDIEGTRITRTVTVRRNMNGSRELWNQFFSACMAAVASHAVVIGTFSADCHVFNGTRKVVDIVTVNGVLKEVYDDSYTFQFKPTRPQVEKGGRP